MSGLVVNKRRLAEIMGVSQRTVTDWQNKGMPVRHLADRGHENQYDTAEVIEWRLQQLLAGEKRESGKERLERLQGDRLELELMRGCEELVEEHAADAMWEHSVLACRGVILSLPSRVKQVVDAEYGIDMDVRLVDPITDEALQRLSEHEVIPDLDDDEPDAEDDELAEVCEA